MTLDELLSALTELACSGDTAVQATLGDMPLDVTEVDLAAHEVTGLTPPQSVMIQLRPLRP